MGNAFLRLFAIDTLIEFVILYLSTTVKNPESKDAQRLQWIVTRLHNATGDFLRTVFNAPV